MAKSITLVYPDEVRLETVLADMTDLNRERSTHRPEVQFDNADFPGLDLKLKQRRIPHTASSS